MDSLAWAHYRLNVATGSTLAAPAAAMAFSSGTLFSAPQIALPPSPAAPTVEIISSAQQCGPCIPYLNETLELIVQSNKLCCSIAVVNEALRILAADIGRGKKLIPPILLTRI